MRRPMKKLGLMCAQFAMLAPVANAQPEKVLSISPTSCRLPPTVRLFSSLKAMPAGVEHDLRSRLKEIADAGEPFNESDVVQNGVPQRRFLGAGLSDRKLFIWYVLGGRSTTVHVIGYWIEPEPASGKRNFGLMPNSHFVNSPCAATLALLSDVKTGVDGDW